MKPFLKWAGNKNTIKDFIIKHIDNNCSFVEPFAGSCAISLNIDAKNYMISDVNSDLINLYQIIINDETFIDYCQSFFVETNNNQEKYYEFRNLFNTTNDIKLKSALFIYLNKHTFNGLCRYNKKGQFNSPFGIYKSPYFPKNELILFKDKLKNASFKCQDFVTTMKESKNGDTIYCDPPYVELTKTASFTTYSKDGFNFKQQEELKDITEYLRKNDRKIIISNHSTEETKELYKNANIIEEFDVQRNISCNGKTRKKVKELLAIYY